MIEQEDIIKRLMFILSKLRSTRFRTLMNDETDIVKLKYRDLKWELAFLIRELQNKQLERNLSELSKFNDQYKSSIKKLEKSLEGQQTMKTTLKNIEQFTGLASRIFLLFT